MQSSLHKLFHAKNYNEVCSFHLAAMTYLYKIVSDVTPSNIAHLRGLAGREGLIDTAIQTAETGFIQQLRLWRTLWCASTTLGAADLWRGWKYIEKQTIETFGLNDREFKHNYRVDVTEWEVPFLVSCNLALTTVHSSCR